MSETSSISGEFNWERAVHTLTNTCQLLDGWHADGTEWSAWDEQVRQEVSVLLKECDARWKAMQQKVAVESTSSLDLEFIKAIKDLLDAEQLRWKPVLKSLRGQSRILLKWQLHEQTD